MTASDHNSAPAVTPSRILVMFPNAGPTQRFSGAARGERPKEFCYGALHLRDGGVDVAFGDTRKDPPGSVSRMWLAGEILRNRAMNFGLSRQRVAALKRDIANADVAISFTDGFSISLGRYRRMLDGNTVLVGGFHGLADMVDEVAPMFRSLVHRQISQAVNGLDHLFFFGEADRQEAIRRYAIAADRTSLFRFGVDTDFWCPDERAGDDGDLVVSVGSDPKRDYPTLVAAPIEARLRIVTSLALDVPADRSGVEVIRGSYQSSAVTDRVLRQFYREAAVVVVPVRDVFQPSGYSVTLQAMACGRPVVLSRIKGLWDPDAFDSGENCLLVPPGDPAALGTAVGTLLEDAGLRGRIGAAARDTATSRFPLARMNDSLAHLINRASEGWRGAA